MNYPDLINIQYQIKKWLCCLLILKTDFKTLTGFSFQPIKIMWQLQKSALEDLRGKRERERVSMPKVLKPSKSELQITQEALLVLKPSLAARFHLYAPSPLT